MQDLAEVVQVPGVDDLARECVDLPERRDEERAERADVHDQEGDDRRRKQQQHTQPGPLPEHRREPEAGSS